MTSKSQHPTKPSEVAASHQRIWKDTDIHSATHTKNEAAYKENSPDPPSREPNQQPNKSPNSIRKPIPSPPTIATTRSESVRLPRYPNQIKSTQFKSSSPHAPASPFFALIGLFIQNPNHANINEHGLTLFQLSPLLSNQKQSSQFLPLSGLKKLRSARRRVSLPVMSLMS